MQCLRCEGTGWLRRFKPHPGCPGTLVTFTRVCPNCERGIVRVLPPVSDGKQAGSGDKTATDYPAPAGAESRIPMNVSTNGTELDISLELQKPALSSSGKTYIVASDRKKLIVNGKEVTVQVNAYYKAE